MEPFFEVSADAEGQFSFKFFDKDGTLMMMGGLHDNQEAAEKTIQDVRVGSLMSNQVAASKTPDGDMFFVIKDSKGQIIAKSVLFQNQMVFNNALHAVKDAACVAEIRLGQAA